MHGKPLTESFHARLGHHAAEHDESDSSINRLLAALEKAVHARTGFVLPERGQHQLESGKGDVKTPEDSSDESDVATSSRARGRLQHIYGFKRD